MTIAQVEVNVYATLRSHVGGAPAVQADIRPGQTVGQLLEQLGIPLEQTRIVFVNHRTATLEHPLQNGDRLGVFPAIGGG